MDILWVVFGVLMLLYHVCDIHDNATRCGYTLLCLWYTLNIWCECTLMCVVSTHGCVFMLQVVQNDDLPPLPPEDAEDTVVLPLPKMSVSIKSTDAMQLTMSKACLEVLTNLGKVSRSSVEYSVLPAGGGNLAWANVECHWRGCKQGENINTHSFIFSPTVLLLKICYVFIICPHIPCHIYVSMWFFVI